MTLLQWVFVAKFCGCNFNGSFLQKPQTGKLLRQKKTPNLLFVYKCTSLPPFLMHILNSGSICWVPNEFPTKRAPNCFALQDRSWLVDPGYFDLRAHVRSGTGKKQASHSIQDPGGTSGWYFLATYNGGIIWCIFCILYHGCRYTYTVRLWGILWVPHFQSKKIHLWQSDISPHLWMVTVT